MRPLLLNALAVLVAVSVGYVVSYSKKPRKETAMPRSEPYVIPQKVKRLYQEPRILTLSQTFSKECQQFWKSLSALDLSKGFITPDGTSCSKLPQPLDAYHELVSQSCKTVTDHCRSAIVQYRAQITHFSTLNHDLSNIRDMRILADKLMATFNRDPALSAKVADRMLELEPDNYTVHKIGLIASLLSDPSAKNNPTHPLWDNLERRLELLRGVEPGDTIAQDELSLFLDVIRENDPEKTYEIAAEKSQTHPQSGVGPYFMAQAEFKKGNLGSAINLLNECLQREPNQSRCQETLKRLQSPDPGPTPFTIQFMFPQVH